MLYKDLKEIEKSKERWIAWWNGEIIDRCLVNISAPNTVPMTSDEKKLFQVSDVPADLLHYWTDAEWIAKRNRSYMAHTWYGGDTFPLINLNLGASGHAGFFRNSRYSFDNRSVWFFPSVSDVSELEFDENSFLYKKTLELAKALAEESNGDYMISMSDCSGNIDALSHLVGPEELMFKMIEEPDEVLEALNKIQHSYKKIHEETFKIVKDVNMGGSCVGWLQTWAPGLHAQMQSDMSVMFSNDMFKQFVEPELRAQADFMDYSLYHLDGMEQIRHLDTLLSIENLHAVQWTQVAGQPPCTEFIPELQKIQKAGKKLILQISPRHIETLMQNLSSKGLLLNLAARSQEEGQAILKDITRLTHE